jgi:hypothetical protein
MAEEASGCGSPKSMGFLLSVWWAEESASASGGEPDPVRHTTTGSEIMVLGVSPVDASGLAALPTGLFELAGCKDPVTADVLNVANL